MERDDEQAIERPRGRQGRRRVVRGVGAAILAIGLVALLASTSPLWTTLIEAGRHGWRLPPVRSLLGVALGLGGLATHDTRVCEVPCRVKERAFGRPTSRQARLRR